MKYFVKYKEYTGRDTHIDKTRFFTCDDIEVEWDTFKSLTANPVSITDILPLASKEQ